MHLLGRRLAWQPRSLTRYPLAQLAPYPLRRAVRGMVLPGPLPKGPVGLNRSFWLLDVLRECAYLLLCCWCIKELLD
uniref:Lens epithelial cell protein LEP503 n=1 Tax=Chrysemys picta bellii TaxID=8478 RepID=A0A8C3IP99_CHRPI